MDQLCVSDYGYICYSIHNSPSITSCSYNFASSIKSLDFTHCLSFFVAFILPLSGIYVNLIGFNYLHSLVAICLFFQRPNPLVSELFAFFQSIPWQVFQPQIQRRRLAYVKHKHLMSGIWKQLKSHILGRLYSNNGEPDTEGIKKLVFILLWLKYLTELS